MGWVAVWLCSCCEKFDVVGAGFGCLRVLVPSMLPLTQVFLKAPGPKIPAEAQFCLKSSVFTQGRCAVGLCWGAVKSQQRDISFSCGL